ncbi:MAG: hypothetical protein JXA90_05465, partial [Planctomycetes bacterium]|nr:hypothetical protein [Planctomycetota bacterium]
EAALDAWRVGRGRRVSREDLAESGAVSPSYLGNFTDLAAELGGDARRFIAALEARSDERAKRFRRDKLEELRSFLAERGCLDEREPIAEAEIVERVVAASAQLAEPAGIAPADVRRRVREMLHILGA